MIGPLIVVLGTQIAVIAIFLAMKTLLFSFAYFFSLKRMQSLLLEYCQVAKPIAV